MKTVETQKKSRIKAKKVNTILKKDLEQELFASEENTEKEVTMNKVEKNNKGQETKVKECIKRTKVNLKQMLLADNKNNEKKIILDLLNKNFKECHLKELSEKYLDRGLFPNKEQDLNEFQQTFKIVDYLKYNTSSDFTINELNEENILEATIALSNSDEEYIYSLFRKYGDEFKFHNHCSFKIFRRTHTNLSILHI